MTASPTDAGAGMPGEHHAEGAYCLPSAAARISAARGRELPCRAGPRVNSPQHGLRGSNEELLFMLRQFPKNLDQPYCPRHRPFVDSEVRRFRRVRLPRQFFALS